MNLTPMLLLPLLVLLPFANAVHPDWWQKKLDKLDLLRDVLREMQRLHRPPVVPLHDLGPHGNKHDEKNWYGLLPAQASHQPPASLPLPPQPQFLTPTFEVPVLSSGPPAANLWPASPAAPKHWKLDGPAIAGPSSTDLLASPAPSELDSWVFLPPPSSLWAKSGPTSSSADPWVFSPPPAAALPSLRLTFNKEASFSASVVAGNAPAMNYTSVFPATTTAPVTTGSPATTTAPVIPPVLPTVPANTTVPVIPPVLPTDTTNPVEPTEVVSPVAPVDATASESPASPEGPAVSVSPVLPDANTSDTPADAGPASSVAPTTD